MNSTITTAIAATLTLLGTSALAQTPPPEVRNFVSCPIVRDTDTVPCWLSEYDGELYFLGIQTDISSPFSPPFLGHKVVVEGRISNDKPRICGGIVLEPVKVSVVPEIDRNCDTILPAEDQYKVDSPRPPGPSSGRLAFQGTDAPRRQAPPPPTGAQEFRIDYSFDGRVEGSNAGQLAAILRHAEAINATRIRIVGRSGPVLLSDGTLHREKSYMAQARAEEVEKLLRGAGLVNIAYDVSWEQLDTADGIDDWEARHTAVTVLP